ALSPEAQAHALVERVFCALRCSATSAYYHPELAGMIDWHSWLWVPALSCRNGSNTHRALLDRLALDARLPTMHGHRLAVTSGGLLAYGPGYFDLFRRTPSMIRCQRQERQGTRSQDPAVAAAQDGSSH